MVTEQEAKERWCPFARVVEITADEDRLQGPFNRYHRSLGHSNDEANCIGSQCMAWRWQHVDTEHFIEAVKRYQNETGANMIEAKRYVESHPEYRRTVCLDAHNHGYCGLAGKP